MKIQLADEQATLTLGANLASVVQPALIIYFHGTLGAGKTTLVRGFVQSFIPGCKVKSPTYTLVESYEPAENSQNISTLHHFDLYRLADAEELEYIGGRDYFFSAGICLVEWPERGAGWLPEADLDVSLAYDNEQRSVEIVANSEKGQEVYAALQKAINEGQ